MMRTPIHDPIEQLVPHAGPMCLLDRALEADQDSLLAEVTIPQQGLFVRDNGVDAWTGIEYMALAISAWAGWHARKNRQQPGPGYLLGTRRYHCSRTRFLCGETLRLEVRLLLRTEEGLGQFDCRISIDGLEVAQAALTVHQPRSEPETEEES
jgi:predicted hotdog family 3-hydroxylacyl-ACP dehydratase